MSAPTGTAAASKYLLRVFEVKPQGAEAPVRLPDRDIEAESIDEARTKASETLAQERRLVRSLSCLAEGGLVAYVLPPQPEPAAEPARTRRHRR